MNEQIRICAFNLLEPTTGFYGLEDKYAKYIRDINFLTVYKLRKDKYSELKVSTQPLLRVFLAASYNLSNDKKVSFDLKPSKIKLKNRSKIVKPYSVIDIDASKQLGDSKEKHLVNFISLMQKQTNLNISWCGDETYKKRYIPYNEWIVFFALFTYYDGRKFIDKFGNHIESRFVKKRSRSPYSYRLAARRTFEFIKKEDFDKLNEEEILFVIKQLQKLDHLFYFSKIKNMSNVREKFFADEFLKKIYDSLTLEYKEVINLKNIFDARVFRNDEFIEKCLEHEYLDPLFAFEYFFRLYMYKNKVETMEDTTFQSEELKRYNVKTTKDKIRLNDLIDLAKSETLGYIDCVCENGASYNLDSFSVKDSDFLKEYYFNNESLLKHLQKYEFETEAVEQEAEYLDYLFSKVIDSIPKFDKDAQ